MSTHQDTFFEAVSTRKIVRTSVRAIILKDDHLLVQIPSDDLHGIHAFIGGEYEYGDSFESRIKKEIEEETNAKVLSWQYLFVVENKFLWNQHLIHGLEHYLLVDIDRMDITSRETALLQKWIPLTDLEKYDIRPQIVKRLIMDNKLHGTKYAVNS